MKRMLKPVCLMGIVSLMAGPLASCKKGGEANTLHFWHTFGQDIQLEMEKQVERFVKLVKQEEGVDLKISLDYQGSYDDIHNKINKSFAAGNTPTIAVAYPDHVADYLQGEKTPGQYVVNLEEFVDDETIGFGREAAYEPETNGAYGRDDMIKAFYDEGTKYARQGLYSLPLMKSTEIMFYNVPLVEALFQYYDKSIVGDKINETLNNMSWDEFMDLCKVAADHLDDISSGLKVPAIYDSDSNLFISQLVQSGIPFLDLDADGKGVLAFNNDDAKAVVADLKKSYDGGMLLTKGTNDGKYGSDLFTNAECIFSIGSSGGSGYNMPSSATFGVGMCRVPPRNDNHIYVSQGPTLALMRSSAYSSDQNDFLVKYGWKLMKYLTSTQVNVDLCYASSGYVPVRASSYTTEDYKLYLEEGEYLAQAAKVVVNEIDGSYLSTPVFRGSATARDEVGGIITQVFLGQRSIDEAFQYAVNQTQLQM